MLSRIGDWLRGRDIMEPVEPQTKALTASPEVIEAVRQGRASLYARIGGVNERVDYAYQRGQAATYGWLYEHQPSVRSVIDNIARRLSQLGLKLYERVDDEERERREDHPAAKLMQYPNGRTPFVHWIFQFSVDFLVYDNAYALKLRDPTDAALSLWRVPPAQVSVDGGSLWPSGYRVWRTDGTYFDVEPDDMVHWHGVSESDPLLGFSKLETLRQVLSEEQAAGAATAELYRSGLKGGHIERPLEAPQLTAEALKRLQESEANQRTASPRLTPIYEEGMKYIQSAISPKDAEMLASRRFTVEEIARLYGVPLGMLGMDSSGLEEQRQQMADVLPPYTLSFAAQLDADLLRAEWHEDDLYFELDLNALLRGDVKDRMAAFTSASGAPWLTRNEVRARENLPPVEGGDELITPANVIVGSNPKPAPNVMPIQNPNGPPQDGSYRREPEGLPPREQSLNGDVKADPHPLLVEPRVATRTPSRHRLDLERQHRYEDEAIALFQRHAGRQRLELTGKADVKYDAKRWIRELAQDLALLVSSIIAREGAVYAHALSGRAFDMAETENWTAAMTDGIAEAHTRAIADNIRDHGLDEALSEAVGEGAQRVGRSVGVRSATFARRAARQQAPNPEVATKMWIADTDRHAEYDGEVVPLDGEFSGGFDPGTQPNCRCTYTVA